MKRTLKKPTQRRATSKNGPPLPAGMPEGMTLEQYRFAVEYLANGCNASAAYRVGHPNASAVTCAQNGWLLLRNAKVRAHIQGRLETELAKRQADGDVVVGLLVAQAFADVRDILDHNGNVLPPQDWPSEAALAVQKFELRNGGCHVSFANKSTAVRLLLELTGKMKGVGNLADVLEAALAKDLGPMKPLTR